MADFNFHLNRQGPQGVQGVPGEPGFSPNVVVETNTAAEYKLRVTTESGSFVTENLRGSAVDDQGGTYMRYDPETLAMYAGEIDVATEENYGAVILASDDDVDSGLGIGVVSVEQMASYVEAHQPEIPSVGNGTITITQGGSTLGSFSVNQTTDITVSIPTPPPIDSALSGGSENAVQNKVITAKVNEITSTLTTLETTKADISDIPDVSEFVTTTDLSDVAITGSYNDLLNKPTLFSGDYNDLANKPTIPAPANDGVLSIYQEGSFVGSFSANSSTNTTINLSGGGGGGGTTYIAGDCINITAGVISAVTSTTLTSQSTHSTLPTSKTVYDALQEIQVGPATSITLGTVKPDNTTIEVDGNGTISTSTTIPTISTMSTAITEATSTMVTSTTVNTMVTISQADYDLLDPPDANTFYIITTDTTQVTQ